MKKRNKLPFRVSFFLGKFLPNSCLIGFILFNEPSGNTGISRILLATTATTALNPFYNRGLPIAANFPAGEVVEDQAANNPMMVNMLGLGNMSLIERFQWLIEPAEKPATSNNMRQYFVYAMIGLICHITIVNLCAVMTLTYGIVRHSTSWAIRLICERRRIRTLMPKSQNTLGANRFDNRRGVVVSQRINTSNINNSSVRIDCSTYPYLLSLALSDLFIGVAIAPLQLDLFVNKGRWSHGFFMCDLWRALDIFFCTSSAMHTAAIAVDRWWSITCENSGITFPSTNPAPAVNPAGSRLPPTVRLQRTLLTFVWILSAMVSVPVMYLWQIESPERLSGNSQICEPVSDNTYLMLSTMVSFFLPLALTIAFYVQIAMLIRSRWTLLKRRTVIEFSSILTSMMMLGNSVARRPAATTLPASLVVAGGFFEENAPSITKAVNSISAEAARNGGDAVIGSDDKISNIARTMNYLKHIRNLIRAMSIVVLMYVLCWLPLYATLLFKAVCRCIDYDEWERLVTFFTWLGYANSGLNPIIYFLTLEEYRVLSLSLFRLIGERAAMLPKIIFRTCWWMSDKRIRSIVKLTDFFISADASAVKSALPLNVVTGPSASSKLARRGSTISMKRRFTFRGGFIRRSHSLNGPIPQLSPSSGIAEPEKKQMLQSKEEKITINVKKSISLNTIMAMAANEGCNNGDLHYNAGDPNTKENNNDNNTNVTICDEVFDDQPQEAESSTNDEDDDERVPLAVPLQTPDYYDQWGRPINYDAIEATI